MLSELVGLVGLDAITVVALGLTPVGLFVQRKRPIIGKLVTLVGVVSQVAYAGASVSDTVKTFLVG